MKYSIYQLQGYFAGLNGEDRNANPYRYQPRHIEQPDDPKLNYKCEQWEMGMNIALDERTAKYYTIKETDPTNTAIFQEKEWRGYL